MLRRHPAASVDQLSPSQLKWLCAIILKSVKLSTSEGMLLNTLLHPDAQARSAARPAPAQPRVAA